MVVFHYNFSEFNNSMSETSLKVSESDLKEAIKLASGVSTHFMNNDIHVLDVEWF